MGMGNCVGVRVGAGVGQGVKVAGGRLAVGVAGTECVGAQVAVGTRDVPAVGVAVVEGVDVGVAVGVADGTVVTPGRVAVSRGPGVSIGVLVAEPSRGAGLGVSVLVGETVPEGPSARGEGT